MDFAALSWNLFHGRDFPPEPGLRTWRSRLLRTTERGGAHAQVNRDLYPQFASILTAADWEVALLQEVPPRWAERLAHDCGAEPHLALTSRNLPLPSIQHLVARFNPDLIASWDGGSNLTLVRTTASEGPAIVERRELVLTRKPERRGMGVRRSRGGVWVAAHPPRRPPQVGE